MKNRKVTENSNDILMQIVQGLNSLIESIAKQHNLTLYQKKRLCVLIKKMDYNEDLTKPSMGHAEIERMGQLHAYISLIQEDNLYKATEVFFRKLPVFLVQWINLKELKQFESKIPYIMRNISTFLVMEGQEDPTYQLVDHFQPLLSLIKNRRTIYKTVTTVPKKVQFPGMIKDKRIKNELKELLNPIFPGQDVKIAQVLNGRAIKGYCLSSTPVNRVVELFYRVFKKEYIGIIQADLIKFIAQSFASIDKRSGNQKPYKVEYVEGIFLREKDRPQRPLYPEWLK